MPEAAGMPYRDTGRGPAVVFLHAFPFHGGMWDPQLEDLCDSCRVIAPDLPPVPSMDAMADAVAALLDELEVSEAVVGGLSMGGYVTFAFLRRYPDRVRGVVLADTRAGADTEEVLERRTRQQAQVTQEGRAPVIEAMMQTLPGEYTKEHRPAVLARMRQIMREVSAEAFVAWLEAMKRRPDSTAELAGIHVPALVVVGEEDQPSPPSVAQEMRDRVPNARLAVVPRAGHLSNLENPEAFNAELRAYLEKV